MNIDGREVHTWRELCGALRQAGFAQAAVWIEAWVDEYLPGEEDSELPHAEGD